MKFYHIRPRFSRVAEKPERVLSNNIHSGAAVFEKFLRIRENRYAGFTGKVQADAEFG